MMKLTAILILITLTTSTASSAVAPGPSPGPESPKLNAHIEFSLKWCVTLSAQEIKEILEFIALIPKIIFPIPIPPAQKAQRTQGLDICLDNLNVGLVALTPMLQAVTENVKHKGILRELAHMLKRSMAHSVNLSKMCHEWFKDADELVPSLLGRKLGDLNLIVDAVDRYISEYS